MSNSSAAADHEQVRRPAPARAVYLDHAATTPMLPAASAASSAIGWTLPTSLLAHMMLITATLAGSRSIASARVAGLTTPDGCTASQSASAS